MGILVGGGDVQRRRRSVGADGHRYLCHDAQRAVLPQVVDHDGVGVDTCGAHAGRVASERARGPRPVDHHQHHRAVAEGLCPHLGALRHVVVVSLARHAAAARTAPLCDLLGTYWRAAVLHDDGLPAQRVLVDGDHLAVGVRLQVESAEPQHVGADQQRRRHGRPKRELCACLLRRVVHRRAGARTHQHVGVVPAAGPRVLRKFGVDLRRPIHTGPAIDITRDAPRVA
mmetsp:Transcript_1236/g.3599  ORF Transcript_1236/g.3599 Transcript_1236/m.3599 type:complete len:228 (-) Transcript_1236:610-1293(-)